MSALGPNVTWIFNLPALGVCFLSNKLGQPPIFGVHGDRGPSALRGTTAGLGRGAHAEVQALSILAGGLLPEAAILDL